MIDPKHIPDEVVEAAAKAAYENLRPKRRWQEAGYIYQQEYRRDARAAVAAAINAWPNMWQDDLCQRFSTVWDRQFLILPLPAPEEKP